MATITDLSSQVKIEEARQARDQLRETEHLRALADQYPALLAEQRAVELAESHAQARAELPGKMRIFLDEMIPRGAALAKRWQQLERDMTAYAADYIAFQEDMYRTGKDLHTEARLIADDPANYNPAQWWEDGGGADPHLEPIPQKISDESAAVVLFVKQVLWDLSFPFRPGGPVAIYRPAGGFFQFPVKPIQF